jgi:hypothetical protein
MKKAFALSLLAVVACVAGCKEEGPMEKAGKEADKKAEEIKDAVNDATKGK